MPRSHARRARLLNTLAVPTALLGSAALVWQGSYAAFSTATPNEANNWTTGRVMLVNDASGSAASGAALWSATGPTAYDEGPDAPIAPGDSATRCIVVTSSGDVAGDVRLFVGDVAATQGLAERLMFTIHEGGGTPGDGSCSGFAAVGAPLAAGVPLGDLPTAHGTGLGAWATSGDPDGESRTYRIRWDFDVSGLTQVQQNALQAATAQADLVWEIQSS